MAKQIFIPNTIYHISYMSFTIPVMTRKIGIESTISQMTPPKNILINTGSPQHTAAIITAPKELSWYAETHSVMAHNDKSAWKANPNKMPRYLRHHQNVWAGSCLWQHTYPLFCLTTLHLVYKSGARVSTEWCMHPCGWFYIPDILAQAEEGRPFILFPWQLNLYVGTP